MISVVLMNSWRHWDRRNGEWKTEAEKRNESKENRGMSWLCHQHPHGQSLRGDGELCAAATGLGPAAWGVGLVFQRLLHAHVDGEGRNWSSNAWKKPTRKFQWQFLFRNKDLYCVSLRRKNSASPPWDHLVDSHNIQWLLLFNIKIILWPFFSFGDSTVQIVGQLFGSYINSNAVRMDMCSFS